MPEPVSRVLMTADAVGGVWTYALTLAHGLSERGVCVLLAVMGGGVSQAQLNAAQSIPGVQVEVSDSKLEWMTAPWDDVAHSGQWLLSLARRFQPDLIHLNGYAHAALPWTVPVVVVAHSDVLSWFQAVRQQEAPAEWDQYRTAVQQGLQAADLVIAPTSAVIRNLRTHYGEITRTRVIFNGLDQPLPCGRGSSWPPFEVLSKFRFLMTDGMNGDRMSRDREGAVSDIILAAGRLWDDAKNLRVLSAVAPNLDWPVYVAGDPTHPNGGGAELPGLHLLGKLERHELTPWYARAKIFAHPALYEPFGYTPLEAALSGCALVLSDTESLREIWNGAALFVDGRDSAAWTEALLHLIKNEPALVELANAAQQRARTFTAQRMTEEYLSTYEQLCESFSSATLSGPTGTTGTRIFFAG